ncbi:hypothetical protein LUZ60_009835 [Juncus effusus]|nr:hypothetical protein LUZ60_009835 [Juncus effusus]
MSCNVDPLIVGRVIGEVVDLFVPTASIDVNFGTKHVNNGVHIKPSMAVDPPSLDIHCSPSQLFTMVMTDPDAPSPSEPTMREWLHWLVVNIPGGSDPSQGDEVVVYMAPKPPLGIHRYVFILFEQKSWIERGAIELNSETRANFSTRNFAEKYELGLPAAAIYFNSQKEPNSRRRR